MKIRALVAPAGSARGDRASLHALGAMTSTRPPWASVYPPEKRDTCTSESLCGSQVLWPHHSSEVSPAQAWPAGRSGVGWPARAYLHGVHGDGQGGVVPVHLVLFAGILVPHGTLVSGPDPEHPQDNHEHQEADAHHDDNGGRAGDNCNETEAAGVRDYEPYSGGPSCLTSSMQTQEASSDPRKHYKSSA